MENADEGDAGTDVKPVTGKADRQLNSQPVDDRTDREILGLLLFMGLEPGTEEHRRGYASLLATKRHDPATYAKALRLD